LRKKKPKQDVKINANGTKKPEIVTKSVENFSLNYQKLKKQKLHVDTKSKLLALDNAFGKHSKEKKVAKRLKPPKPLLHLKLSSKMSMAKPLLHAEKKLKKDAIQDALGIKKKRNARKLQGFSSRMYLLKLLPHAEKKLKELAKESAIGIKQANNAIKVKEFL